MTLSHSTTLADIRQQWQQSQDSAMILSFLQGNGCPGEETVVAQDKERIFKTKELCLLFPPETRTDEWVKLRLITSRSKSLGLKVVQIKETDKLLFLQEPKNGLVQYNEMPDEVRQLITSYIASETEKQCPDHIFDDPKVITRLEALTQSADVSAIVEQLKGLRSARLTPAAWALRAIAALLEEESCPQTTAT